MQTASESLLAAGKSPMRLRHRCPPGIGGQGHEEGEVRGIRCLRCMRV